MVGNVVDEWLKIGAGKTLLVASSAKDSKDYANRFCTRAVAAEHVGSSTPERGRDAILARSATARTQIVCKHGVLCEDYDLPNIETVVLKRTGALMTYLQMVGRGIRAAKGKELCIVIDPSGNVFRFSFPWEYRTYSLKEAPKEHPITVPP